MYFDVKKDFLCVKNERVMHDMHDTRRMTPDAWHRMKPLPFYQVEYFWKDSRCVG
jgi:hypothetical protein